MRVEALFAAAIRRGVAVIAALGCLVAVVLALPLVERYEARVAPVLRAFSIDEVRQISGAVIASGVLDKQRDCRFRQMTMYAGDADDPSRPRERLTVQFLYEPTVGDLTREPGVQSWGPWRIVAPRTGAGPDLFMRVSHQCHPLYQTRGVYFVTPLASVFAAEDGV